jgi:hypothetical protein
MLVHFLHFYNVYAYGSVICKYRYWLPLEWYCIFLEAGSANSISAIVSGKNGKTNNNSFCFVSVSNAFCRYWVLQLKTRRHMEKFSLILFQCFDLYREASRNCYHKTLLFNRFIKHTFVYFVVCFTWERWSSLNGWNKSKTAMNGRKLSRKPRLYMSCSAY